MQDSFATVFLGREAEIENLAALAPGDAAGKGSMALVEGEPGIGKTALLDAACLRYSAAELHLRRGTARELQRDMPFSAVRSWFAGERAGSEPTSDPIRALLHSGNRAGDAAATHEIAIAEAILDRIDAWCSAGPVVLIMDDVHWADASSLAVLRRLCEFVDGLPLLVVLAARPLPRTRAVAALSAELVDRRAPMIRLGALSEAAAELVRHMVGAAPGPDLLREVAGAGGNPLYLTELVAALLREKAIMVVADSALATATTAGERASASVADTISRRLNFLSRRTRDVLPMAAALGPTVDVAELAVVLDAPILEIWNAVTEAMVGGLLTVVHSELVFRHDVIRDALAEQLPASLRSGLLRRAGQVLQATDAPIERVAYYLAAGDNDLDQASLDWLLTVADELVVRAPELAVRLLSRATRVPGLHSGSRSTLIRVQTQALLWTGCAAEAEAVVRAALSTRPEHRDKVELRWLLAQACQAQARMADAVEVAETALATMDLGVDEAGRFQGMCAVDNFFLGRFEAAERAGKQAMALGASSGNPLTTSYGLTAIGAVRYTRGHLDEALELSARIPVLLADGAGPEQFDPYALSAHCLIELDRLADAEEVLAKAIGRDRRVHGAYLSSNLACKARLYLLSGRWDDAVAECTALLDTPDPFGYAQVGQLLAALIGVHRGTFVPDSDRIPAPDDSVGSTGYAHFHHWVTALTEEARGHPDRALALLVDTYQRLAGGLAAATLHYIFPDIARLAADVGDAQAARLVVVGADELLARQPTAARNATALLCRGLADHDPDVLLYAAAAAFRQFGRPLYEAQAYENAAMLLAAAGREADARRGLATAMMLYSRLGASWDTARAIARVRPYGIRLGVRGRRNRPKSGWAALTDTERKIATLVTKGSSNSDIAAQMFLSRRTIQSHVSNILAKLDLHWRREIAAAMPQSR
ncbi:AAA family ATPase [Nocardia sp. NPDC049190]|uniref:helix-turn-helix transcriptional regulator n=1 Tax=Nocardia sp. NPDC049190 TaxID=3155650 RepID=UPI003411C678